MQTRRDFLGSAIAIGAATALDPRSLFASPAPKKLLILGGTGFIGPHNVRAALARGHTVSVFNRGRSGAGMFGKDVEELVGDRAANLDALKGRKWDAVIDESASGAATAPEWVKLSAELLRDSVDQYLFISTRSAYSDVSLVPMTSNAPTFPDVPAGQTRTYGQAKAMAERVALATLPGRVTIVRPGLIIGPGDDTDRFTYWPFRVSKGGEMLAPGDGTDHVQIIDVRDLMEFSVKLVEDKTFGMFNGVGPDKGRPFKDFLERIQKGVNGNATFTWVAADFLIANNARPYGSELPSYQVMSGRTAGFARFDLTPEIKAGLKFRPIEVTAKETLDWYNAGPGKTQPWTKVGLKPEREKELLTKWHALKGKP